MRFRYRFLHKCCCYFVVLFFNRLSLCTMPSYDVGFWVCECVIKCMRPYMHPCSMPRPLGSDTGSCTNAAATLWVWFFNRLSLCTMPSYDVGFWVCECVIKCMRPYMHPGSMPRPLGSDTGSCTNAAATLWVWFFNRLSLFVRCLLMMLVRESVSVKLCASIRGSMVHAKTIKFRYRF